MCDQLHPHQQAVLPWLHEREQGLMTRHVYAKPPKAQQFPFAMPIFGGMICMSMGMGKTRLMIEHMKNHYQPNEPTLVVVPPTAFFTWRTELTKWWPAAQVLLMHSSEVNLAQVTLEQLRAMHVVIVSYDLVVGVADMVLPGGEQTAFQAVKNGNNIIARPPAPMAPTVTQGRQLLLALKWARIIVDESHMMANRQTKRFRAMMTLCAATNWCLTGTPMRNKVEDLYTQFKFLGYTDMNDVEVFKKFFDLDLYAIFLDYEQVGIQLPPCTEIVHKIPMLLLQHIAYDMTLRLTRDAYAMFEAEGTLTAWQHLFTMFLRLRQIAVCPASVQVKADVINPYMEQLDVVLRCDAEMVEFMTNPHSEGGLFCPKINQVMQIIADTPLEDKVIVFTMFKPTVRLVHERCIRQGVSAIMINGDVTGTARIEALHNFKQNPAVKVLVISFQVGAESLNLAEAAHAIFMEPWFSPATLAQAKARIHRFGQTKATVIHKLVARDSIEEGIYQMVEYKSQMINAYLDKPLQGEVISRETLSFILFNRLEKKRRIAIDEELVD